MPVNGFSVGKDLSLSLITSDGPMAFAGITDYTIKPSFSKLSHKGQNGKKITVSIPDGWEITAKVDRSNNDLDDYFAGREAAYFSGQNVLLATALESIQETDGTISQYRYTDIDLSLAEAGSWKGDGLVSLTVVLNASMRVKVA